MNILKTNKKISSFFVLLFNSGLCEQLEVFLCVCGGSPKCLHTIFGLKFKKKMSFVFICSLWAVNGNVYLLVWDFT